MNLFIHKCPPRPSEHGKHCFASPPSYSMILIRTEHFTFDVEGGGRRGVVVRALYLDSGFFS